MGTVTNMNDPLNRYQAVIHMLERIGEPLYVPKGDGNVIYNIPDIYLDARIRPIVPDIITSVTGSKQPDLVFPIQSTELPDLTEVYRIPRDGQWSIFIPAHRRAAYQLTNILTNQETFDKFLSTAVACRDRINRSMFVYALSAASIRRTDLAGIRLPPIWEVLPDRFVDSGTIRRAQREAALPTAQRSVIVLDRNFTGTDLEPEHKVAYWREDLGINSHHWHWHLVYPLNALDRDRKGELFYYMHRQIVARYDAERMCNGLNRVVRQPDWAAPASTAYFPKLTNENAGFVWGTRSRNSQFSDVNRPDVQLAVDLDDLRRWRTRIFEAIHRGFITRENGDRVDLSEDRGIDILGDIVEASDLTPNPNLYGDMHNMGHVALAFIHDPDGRHRENMCVMGDTTTAMRDPAFYNWHKFVDDVFDEFKMTLRPYTEAQLGFPPIQLQSVDVTTPNRPPNVFVTFWQNSELDLARGLDFRPFSGQGPVMLRFSHLQHEPYVFRLQVNNTARTQMDGTVRIFIAPRLDEIGQRLSVRDQRFLFIELDKFQQRFNPGMNRIERRSDQSGVSIPFEQTFRQLRLTFDAAAAGGGAPPTSSAPGTAPPNVATPGSGLSAEDQYCGCGWPDHAMIPRGTEQGIVFDLFVMVSNWQDDRVELRNRNQNQQNCRSAASYCGLRDDLFPDRRAMGFPFDRLAREGLNTLEDFRLPNMFVGQCTIQHENRTVARQP